MKILIKRINVNEKVAFYIFIFMFLSLLLLVFFPFFLHVSWIKKSISIFLKPLGNNISTYVTMLGSILGITTTLFFTIWQNQKNILKNKEKEKNLMINEFLANIQDIRLRMYDTIETIDILRLKINRENENNVIRNVKVIDISFKKLLYSEALEVISDSIFMTDLQKKYDEVIKNLSDYMKQALDIRTVWYDLNFDLPKIYRTKITKAIDDFEQTSEKILSYKN